MALHPAQRTPFDLKKALNKALLVGLGLFTTLVVSGFLYWGAFVPINGNGTPMQNLSAAAGALNPFDQKDDDKSEILDGCKPGTRTDNDRDGDCLDNSIDQCPDYANADSNGNIFLCPVDASPDPGNPGNGECAGAPALAIHQQFLAELDPYFHDYDWKTWFDTAGFTADSVKLQARQPEEDSFDTDGDLEGDLNLVSGLQVDVKNAVVIWPNVVTTNDPGRITKKLKGYQANLVDSDGQGSTQYTNVIANGEVTVYASGFSWSQLSTPFACVQPEIGDVHANSGITGSVVDPGITGAAGAQPTPPSGEESDDWCYTAKQLDDLYGIDRNAQGADNGLLKENGRYEGAVIHVTPAEARELRDHGWTIQGTNPGIKSAWNPMSCR